MKPLFLIGIPKAGTHMLIKLVELLGYQPGIMLRDEPKSDHWYCVQGSNSHTPANDFFLSDGHKATDADASFHHGAGGNRYHIFPTCPALFIYRHPLDILFSEANYYHLPQNTLWHGYLYGLSFRERINRLLYSPLLGHFKDRLMQFQPWLEFPNVIPVSYEEIVGAKGGGCDTVQHNCIRNIINKLDLDAAPDTVVSRLYGDSPTFHTGRIGRGVKYWRENFSSVPPGLQEEMNQLLDAFGYNNQENFSEISKTINDKPIILSTVDYSDKILSIDYNFFNYSIVKTQGHYLAIPHGSKNVNHTKIIQNGKEGFIVSTDLSLVKRQIILKEIHDDQ